MNAKTQALQIFSQKSLPEIDCFISNLAFHDLTPPNVIVPPGLKNLLGLNLNFCMTPNPISKKDLKKSLMELERSMRLKFHFRDKPDQEYNKNLYISNKNWIPPHGPEPMEQIFDKINNNINVMKMPTNRYSNLSTSQKTTLKLLQDRKDLKVCMTDKNLGPALLSTDQYIKLVKSHLNTTTYRKCQINSHSNEDTYVRLVRAKVMAFASKVQSNFPRKSPNIITHDIKNKRLNLLYGNPKIHKIPLKIRPIVSNSNGLTNGLSIWINEYMKKYMTNQKTYLRDSDQLVDILKSTTVEPNDTIITFDVISMYTSLQIQHVLETIRQYLPNDYFHQILTEGLEIIMKNNYFTFLNEIYLQLDGTAMGTPVAPVFASLFCGIIEIKKLLVEFSRHIKLYKRFIDDGFAIWNFHDKPKSFDAFISRFSQLSKLEFTYEIHPNSAPFLDLEIYRGEVYYETRTYQKDNNLYLYIPPTSAHPPGILKSLVYGRIQKYQYQNSQQSDLEIRCQQLYDRLKARGHEEKDLDPLFIEAMTKTPTINSPTKQILIKFPFDPNGPSKPYLRTIFETEAIENFMKTHTGITKTTICFTKPMNLRSQLCRSRLEEVEAPHPLVEEETKEGV
jgi:hypothetical protein